MIKNKVLTPVLAGILGVSVVGSGVGYYLVNKDSDKGVKPEQTMDTMKLSLTQVEQNVNNSVQDVEKAVKGELDYAYDSSLKITFGDGMNVAGIKAKSTDGKQTIKPIEIDTKVKQKGQNSQAEISAKYNDATLATFETIYVRDKNTAYFRIPELSSAYITATEDELKKTFEDYANKYKDRVAKNNGLGGNTQKQTDDSTAIKEKLDLKNFGIKTPEIKNIDSEKLEKKLKEYYELIKGKLPVKKDGANVTGEIDGNKYDYKTVGYSITGAQVNDILNTVLDKMATDADLKKMFDDAMGEAKSKAALGQNDVKSYAELIAKLKEQVKVPSENQNKTASVDLYYDGEDVVGGAVKYDGKELAKVVFINKNDVNAVDAFIKDQNDKGSLTLKGSAKLADGTVNGTYAINYKDNNASGDITLKLDKVVLKDDYFSGTVSLSFNGKDSSGIKKSGAMTLSGDCTKDKKNIKFSVDTDGKNMMTIEFKQNKTEATDIAVPTEKTFKLDQIEQYKATCDFDNFKQGINDALGTNVFGMFDNIQKLAEQAQTNKTTTSTNNFEIDYDDLVSA